MSTGSTRETLRGHEVRGNYHHVSFFGKCEIMLILGCFYPCGCVSNLCLEFYLQHVVEFIEFSNVKADKFVAASVAASESDHVALLSASPSPGVGGAYLVSASRDRTVKVWDTSTGVCLFTLLGHDNWVRTVRFHPNGRFIVSAGEDRTIRIWDILDKRCKRKIEDSHNSFVTCLDFNTTGTLLVSGSVDKSCHVWQCK